MKINEGTVDRAVRIIVGLAMLYPFFFGEGLISYLSIVGAVPLITGIAGHCPLYGLLGVETCSIGQGRHPTHA